MINFTFSDLTRRLNNINFGIIKDIRKGLLQKQIFKDCPGACVLTSIYNAIPALFKYNYNRVKQLYKELGMERVFDPYQVTNLINEKFEGELLKCYPENDSNYDRNDKLIIQEQIKQSIDNNLAIILVFTYKQDIIDNKIINHGHAITIVGYDNRFYYAYDNTFGGDRVIYAFIENTLEYNKVFNNDTIIGQLQDLYRKINKPSHDSIKIEDILLEYLKNKKLFIKQDKNWCCFDKNLIYELMPMMNAIRINKVMINELYEKLRNNQLNMSTFKQKRNFENIYVFDNRYAR